MKRPERQSGFTLITAIFLLVVVAGLMVYMVNIRSVQQTTLLYGIQGARAMQAARTGIEWGVYQSITNGNCLAPYPTFAAPGIALNRFQITVSCTMTSHTEGVPLYARTTYQITSTAIFGNFGTLDYISRALRATVSPQPP